MKKSVVEANSSSVCSALIQGKSEIEVMEEEDHDELLQCSDEESMSESDDQCIPMDKPEDVHTQVHVYASHSKTEFILSKLTLVLSATSLLILLPLYQESINVKGDAYVLIYFNTTLSTVILFAVLLLVKRFCPRYGALNVSKPPIKLKEIALCAFIYTLSGFIIVYAVDRKKVMCHLQDPIKGLILVFSLIYYFFFCKKLMGLQRIFSTTTIIVGLFISVDYGLCNEFRCRGNDREHKSDDAGVWTWQAHSVWAAIYIFGLALFSAYYMLLDRYLICSTIVPQYPSFSSQLLSTVSRLVSFQTVNNSTLQQNRPLTTSRASKKVYSALHLTFWIHIFTWIYTVALFWTDILPNVGKSTNMTEFFNHTTSGLICIFSTPKFGYATLTNCGNTSIYAWLFLLSYLVFTISSIRFLILCQSAVYTIATCTVALPMVGIWWSLFKMTSVQRGLLLWSPTVSGELICALLGLPIVVVGLGLLCKSHFKDCHTARISANGNCVPSSHLA